MSLSLVWHVKSKVVQGSMPPSRRFPPTTSSCARTSSGASWRARTAASFPGSPTSSSSRNGRRETEDRLQQALPLGADSAAQRRAGQDALGGGRRRPRNGKPSTACPFRAGGFGAIIFGYDNGGIRHGSDAPSSSWPASGRVAQADREEWRGHMVWNPDEIELSPWWERSDEEEVDAKAAGGIETAPRW